MPGSGEGPVAEAADTHDDGAYSIDGFGVCARKNARLRCAGARSPLDRAGSGALTVPCPKELPWLTRPRITALVPAAIRPPFAAIPMARTFREGAEWVFHLGTARYRGRRPCPEDVRAQADLCFAACEAILSEAGFARDDTVRINAFVTDRAHMAGYMAARDAWCADMARLPASTLVIVSGFTRPEFKVEVEVTAARLPRG